jgi:hypothetical protein
MGSMPWDSRTALWIALEGLLFLVLAGLAVAYMLGTERPILPLAVFVAFAGLLVARRIERRTRMLRTRHNEDSPRSE